MEGEQKGADWVRRAEGAGGAEREEGTKRAEERDGVEGVEGARAVEKKGEPEGVDLEAEYFESWHLLSESGQKHVDVFMSKAVIVG